MSRLICVDASFALKLVLDEPGSEQVGALWAAWIAEGTVLKAVESELQGFDAGEEYEDYEAEYLEEEYLDEESEDSEDEDDEDEDEPEGESDEED